MIRAVAILVVLGSAAAIGQAPADMAGALKGAVDIHVHSLPDDRPRSVDAVEAARQARDRGMRAIVLQNYYESTAGCRATGRCCRKCGRSSARSRSTI
jgi:hypothetical protein